MEYSGACGFILSTWHCSQVSSNFKNIAVNIISHLVLTMVEVSYKIFYYTINKKA